MHYIKLFIFCLRRMYQLVIVLSNILVCMWSDTVKPRPVHVMRNLPLLPLPHWNVRMISAHLRAFFALKIMSGLQTLKEVARWQCRLDWAWLGVVTVRHGRHLPWHCM
jgi:hypothetical protein